MDGLRERVADAFRRDSGDLRHGEVDEPALVRVQRAELLIDAGLPDLLGEELRHLAQLEILALAVLERIDWNIAHVGEVIAPRTVTSADGLEERITYEPVGVVAHVSAWNYPYFVALNSIVPALR